MKNERFVVRHLVYQCHIPRCTEAAEYLCEHSWDARGGYRKVTLRKCRKHAKEWAYRNDVTNRDNDMTTGS